MLRHDLRAHQSRRRHLRQSRARTARCEVDGRRGQRLLHGARSTSIPSRSIVAEEMNTTTRVEHFKNMVRAQDYDGILTLAKKLVNEGSHMLDLCCAIVGEDEKAYISNILEKIATRVPAPITGRFHRSRRDRRGAEAHSRQGHHQLHQSGGRREAHLESSADGQALRRGGHRADHRRRRHGADLAEEAGHRQAHLRPRGEQVRHPSRAI